jgi:tetrahydromethanopterin S-methyltransferase subunit A
VVGEYFVLNSSAPVAVATLASIQLAEELAHLKPVGLGLVGKLETENIGIDKIVKNTISNPAIRFIIVAGLEPVGHHSGSALLALYQNGVDDNNRVLGSTAKRPVLRNVTSAEIDAFRKQVQIVDLLGCEDPVEITNRVTELVSAAKAGGLLLGQSTNQKSFIQQAQQNTLKDLTLCADS